MSDGTRQIAHFRIEREIARGGHGPVYLAEDTRLGRKVAIKVVSAKPGVDGDVAGRFEREAEALARLDHPGICTVHEVGVDKGRSYMAMRFVEGETLAARIAGARGDGPGDVVEAVAFVERAANSVHAAHEAGIVHCDLKPGNIMVTPQGAPVILDFGLARDQSSPPSMSLSGDVFGTPAYMAPEQIRPSLGQADRRTDVYALGAILYECLTHRRPSEAPTREGVYHAILDLQPLPARRLNPAVPRDLEVVIETALAKEPDRRYATALDLAEDLRRVRMHEPILARPVGPVVRFRRWARRNPALAVSLVGLIIALSVGLVATAGLLVGKRQSLARSIRQQDVRTLPALLEAAQREHWPALPQGVPAMDAWLEEADAIAARRDGHERHLARLSAAQPTARREREEFVVFMQSLADLEETIAEVRRRREDGLAVVAQSIEAHSDAWAEAIHAIADMGRNPRYAGLIIDPQVGLVPIGQDPESGLFEFAHLQTGRAPVRDDDTGRLVRMEDMGLVFVLLPGGNFRMGAEPPSEAEPEGSPHIDPHMTLEQSERPVHRIELDPFFISKYEMTQGQWVRTTGVNPSGFTAEDPRIIAQREAHIQEYRTSESYDLHPVEGVSWRMAHRELSRLGLTLPTEAQWEYAARAGTTTVWWTGNDAESLRDAANIGTIDFGIGIVPSARGSGRRLDDYYYTSPVGTFRANAFGLHDVHGNVVELTRDWHGSYELPVRPGDGERQIDEGRNKVRRGGGWVDPAHRVRSAERSVLPPDATWGSGVRPARAITSG